jgi:hypothetical protein
MTVDPITDTYPTTYANDDHIAPCMHITSPRPEGVPYARIVTLPTFFSTTYGLTLLASRQLRWTSNILATNIPTWIPNSLRKPLLNQVPTVTRSIVDKLIHAKDTCTVHTHDI